MCWRNFCNFSLVTKNVKSRSKMALFFQNERHFDKWFPKKKTTTFSEVNYPDYTKTPNFACGNYIFPKTRGNKNKPWTHSTPLKGIESESNNIFLWHELENINKKKLISKISVDSDFPFSSYAWLCVFHCSHRLLCWIKSRVRDFSVKIAFISYWNDFKFSLIPLGNCAS